MFVHPAKRSKPLSIQHLRLVSDKADCIVISASSCQCTVWSAKAVRRSLCHHCVVCAVGPSPAAIAVFPFLEIWSFGELPNCRNSQYSDFYKSEGLWSLDPLGLLSWPVACGLMPSAPSVEIRHHLPAAPEAWAPARPQWSLWTVLKSFINFR